MMSAADEYRRMAEQCLRWAREAKSEEEQTAFLEMATNWSQRAAQEAERILRLLKPARCRRRL
jgi:hypothetical protein